VNIRPTISPQESSRTDVDTLVARVTELERTQQQEDVEGFLALFDPRVVWVTGGGKRLIGLDVISAFTRTVLPGAMSDGSVRYAVEHILFIAPDVALTGVRQQYVDLAGNPTAAGLPSYVWHRTGGAWKIIVGQNTAAENPVIDDEQNPSGDTAA
jgi:uncharacterized protein (TIGR02246 family)